MVKLLIVDDEYKTRHGLQEHMSWETLGISSVETAGNSEEAVKLCTRYVPDIILSDIRMPGMNGIELCSYIKEQIPNCEIIFLSGYADKEYLKAAIELNAVSYVEKPIIIEEVEKAVQKAVQRMKEKKSFLPASFMKEENFPLKRQAAVLSLVMQKNLSGTELESMHLFPPDVRYFRVVLIQCSQSREDRLHYEERLQKMLDSTFGGIKHEVAFKDNRHAIIICAGTDSKMLVDDSFCFRALKEAICAWEWDDRELFAAVGEMVSENKQLYQSYYTATITLQRLFFLGYGKTAFYREGQTLAVDFDEKLYDTFSACIDRRDCNEAIHVLDEVYHRLKVQDDVIATSIKNIYFRFGYRLETARKGRIEVDKEKSEAYGHYIWEKFTSLDTLQEIKEYIKQKTLDTLYISKYDAIVTKVISLIQSHYAQESLSVKWLAAEAYVSSAYLSRLFKQQTGKSVGQMITEIRMEHAKEMLLDRNLKLHHIALAVGYCDASYFAKAFKKTVGIMPSEYRERNL